MGSPEILFASETIPFAAMWMDLEIIVSEARKRQIPYDSIYITWGLKDNTNELILLNRNRLTDMENKLTVPKGKGSRCCCCRFSRVQLCATP